MSGMRAMKTRPGKVADLARHRRDRADTTASIERQLHAIRDQIDSIQRSLRLKESTRHRFDTQSCVTDYIAARRRRGRFFPKDLFADPAWDMLLDLWLGEERDTLASVSSLCLASGSPPTTALRWIAHLDEAGLIRRIPDQTDRRRQFIVLSSRGRKAMAGFLGTTRDGAFPLPSHPDVLHESPPAARPGASA